jgi:tetratricopeptide (TPR) repeat protein
MALERYPKSARAHTYYGELLYDYLGDEPRGVREWEEAKRLDPKHSLALNNLGIHYCHVGEYDKGIEHLEESLRLDPDHPDLLFNVCQVYLVHPDPVSERHNWDRPQVYREAMKLSKKAIQIDPTDYDLLADYARNFFLAERAGVKPEWVKSAKAWENAREHARNDAETFHTWLFEARARLRAGQHRRARNCLLEARSIHPDSAAVNTLLEKAEAGHGGQ